MTIRALNLGDMATISLKRKYWVETDVNFKSKLTALLRNRGKLVSWPSCMCVITLVMFLWQFYMKVNASDHLTPQTGSAAELLTSADLDIPRSHSKAPGTHSRKVSRAHCWNLADILFASISIFGDIIKSQLCTCLDSSAVVACAKLWLDWIIIL